jgi:hypothetical protein
MCVIWYVALFGMLRYLVCCGYLVCVLFGMLRYLVCCVCWYVALFGKLCYLYFDFYSFI